MSLAAALLFTLGAIIIGYALGYSAGRADGRDKAASQPINNPFAPFESPQPDDPGQIGLDEKE